jgi:glycolate oxidase FAD binding subunit
LTAVPVLRPANAEQLCAAVNEALRANTTLEIVGTGARRGYGAPVTAQALLDLGALNGIVQYQPEELVLTLGPATPMAEVTALLHAQRQMLAFEPPDFGPLWGLAPGLGTIGGCLMVGRGGARRISAGAPRDHCLGIKGVNGFGAAFGAGGRVVKNVTGFDLSKLVVGSCGTLCVLSQITVKVLPAPQDCATLALAGLSDADAVALMSQALGTTAQVASAAHLPADVARDSAVPAVAAAAAALTLVRLEGSTPSVQARREHLRARFQAHAPLTVLDREESAALWSEISDATYFARFSHTVVWKLSVAPTAGAALGRSLAGELHGRCYYDWGGGAVWLELPAAPDAHEGTVRARLRACAGGHATLLRAADAVRAAVSPLQPLEPDELRVTRAVKAQFDPHGLFNPGRLWRER